MDVMTKSERSACMSRIRGKDTSPEVRIRKSLWRKGIRYHLQAKVFGKPDLYFPGAALAVFVDGCFWHCCPRHATRPKSNAEFWEKKLDGNLKRDFLVNETLNRLGIQVLRFWEHE